MSEERLADVMSDEERAANQRALNAMTRQDRFRLMFGQAVAPEQGSSGIEALVCEDIKRRQALGVKKYGVTVEGNPLPLEGWLEHAYLEALDMAIYLRRAMEEMRRS